MYLCLFDAQSSVPSVMYNLLAFLFQTVNFHARKDTSRGIINNQQSDWTFKIDGVLHDVSQEEVYDEVARNVVLKALDGYNGTIMCYGQTGAGKTYTMTGATETYKQRGVIPRAVQQVFKEIENRPDQAIAIRISFLEIYNESLSDLLATMSACQPVDSQMTIVDEKNCIYVRGLSVHRANNEEEAFSLLFEGETNRVISSHSLNRYSSRSHCIFTIHIESRSRTLSDPRYVTSKLNLVDLAGSERLGKTRSEGQVLKEAMYINKSLTFLEQAILALADRKRDHVPFRQSKLTHVLKDSLGGNCNTVLVANIYGDVDHMEETLSTLRFATRMKCIRTDPAVNEHYDPVVIDAFEDFKLDSGSEINRIFEQNKAILLEKRRNVRQLVEGINIFKKEIDNTKLALQVKEQERQYINEEGDTIIDEEEFQLILKLKDLKASYRTHYDQLFSLRTEVQYCQHLVDQCRIRLLSEFDSWYNETFLIPEDIQRAVKTCGPLRPGMLTSMMDNPATPNMSKIDTVRFVYYYLFMFYQAHLGHLHLVPKIQRFGLANTGVTPKRPKTKYSNPTSFKLTLPYSC
uniref:Kinesin-like protein n=1 Tax=Erpetoichthys calabaricus TaxID=27687 RepID=A0A8C4XAB8_ERPCA